jgi:hypothetical protein
VAWDNDESGAGDVIEQRSGAPDSRRPGSGLPGWLGFLGRGSGGRFSGGRFFDGRFFGGRFSGRGPGWRPSPGGAILLAAVTLLAGLAAGYAAGKGTNGGAATPRPSVSGSAGAPGAATATSQRSDPLADVGAAVEQVPESCSAQNGSQLQLGIDVTNQSKAAVTLTGVKPVFPGDAGALREITWEWAPCGAITFGAYQPTVHLAPDETAWLSVTFKVLVTCPAAYPVQFRVSYTSLGTSASTTLTGFPDLGDVPYMGCPTQQSVSGSGAAASVLLSPSGTPCLPPQPELPADRVTRTSRVSLPSCMSW